MSKRKEKTSKGAGTSTESTNSTTAATNGSSELSTATFDQLRQKIEGNLKKAQQNKSKGNRKPKEENKSSANANAEQTRGKKRNIKGEVVDRNVPRGHAGGFAAVHNEADLQAIVEELGGGKEDLEMIENAQSDSEVEGVDVAVEHVQPKHSKTKTLESGMANILKEIALARKAYGEDDQTSEDEGADADTKPSAAKKTTPAKEQPTPIGQPPATNSKGPKTRLVCQARPEWYLIDSDLDLELKPKHPVKSWSVEQLHDHARKVLQKDNEAFRTSQASSSSQAFYNTVMSSGTLSDKISALTLAVQESPMHNMKALEVLLSLARKRSRSQAVDVLGALKDLFAQGSLLPSSRRLYTFSTQPALEPALGHVKSWQEGDSLPAGLTDELVATWAFEHWLKEQYFDVLKVLENWCNDEIEFSKSKALNYVADLLREKPEQESNLLRLLVNKLGDPVKKIASQASYQIMQLLSLHPAMKEVVVSAIETDFIFRPGQSLHAKYYAAVTLNQTALNTNEEKIAIKLLDIYFALFKALLKPGTKDKAPDTTPTSETRAERQRKLKKSAAKAPQAQQEELREKLISALLTGVNRAYPYCGTDHRNFEQHLDTLFQITHSANFNTSIQAMMLIQRLISTNQASGERFYKTLYESLLDPRLVTSSKQQLYLNLLHRSLKTDLNMKRLKAFVKRILQVLTLHEPSFICGVYFLLKDLEKTFPALSTLLDESEDHEADEETFRDADEGSGPILLPSNEKSSSYDPSKRAPEHANADASCAWEVLPFLAHYHPAVSLSADHVLEHTPLPGKPDLTLHTLIHFLDRFVYKNPKLSSTKMRGSSIMQPMANDDTHAVLISTEARNKKQSVNSEEFRNKKEGDVAAEDVFFHQYFNSLGKTPTKKAKKARDTTEDASIGSEDDEDDVWNAMMSSAPGDLEGIEDDEGDEGFSDMSDFEAEMNDSAMEEDEDDDGEVDVEEGIFDDLEENAGSGVPSDLEESEDEADFEGLDSASDQEEDTKTEAPTKKWKAERERKQKLKALPTFASAADYAKLIENDDDEDLG